VTTAGDLVFGGIFDETVDIAGMQLVSAGNSDGYLAALSSDGTGRWTAQLGGPDSERVIDVARGPDGSVAMVGIYDPGARLAGTVLPEFGDRDSVVALFDGDGRLTW
jgi:hypothetical protein